MARDWREDRAGIYDAAERFVDQYLRTDGSMFSPGVVVGSLENVNDLHHRFNAQPDAGAASFLDKFEVQLDEADDSVVQLAAELVFVHLIFADDIGGPSKRQTISRVLSWMDDPVTLPPELDEVLDVGLANTGIAFKTYRPHQLWLLIDFLRAWKNVESGRQDELLEDPWRFKEFLFEVPLTAAYTQREALLHLVHPDTFESIVSRDHKRMIVEALGDPADDVDDVDRALLEIRRSLTSERPDFRGFYEQGIVEVWRPAADEEPEPGVGRLRAWLLRHKVGGTPRLSGWLEDGYGSIGWSELGPAVVGATREQLAAAMEEAYPDHPPGRLRNAIGNVDRFLRRMKVGDLVVTPDGDEIFVGLVTSAPRFVEGSAESFRRSVEWANPNRPIARGDLSASAYSKLRALLTVSDVTDDALEFVERAGIELVDIEESAAPTPRRTGVHLPAADQVLADELLLPQEWLQRTVNLLTVKRQVVFYGPPGTGKTFVAQRLADHLTQHGGNYLLVQFHPSYAYEDFFEGFRPRESVGGAGVNFELVPGPLRRLAEQAREEPDSPHLLIIDEINRANLAKVFGELYFLLEYRDQAIALQYSPDEEFELPSNLYVIGTMNTADRSIALVDSAMRRRFYFAGFFPQQPPIDGLLERWLTKQGYDREPARLLDELNRRIDDKDFAVGPSYLMADDVQAPGGLERVWEHAILPLLEEHYIGTPVGVDERFGLDALRSALQAPTLAQSSGSAHTVVDPDDPTATDVP